MLGKPFLLAGKAALRCGSGKVHILSTDEHLDMPSLYSPELNEYGILKIRITKFLENADVVAIGPGLGLSSWSQQVFETVIGIDKPLVIDADALTLLAQSNINTLGNNRVLTPHPGEAASLLKL